MTKNLSVRYTCNECEYIATMQYNLNRHKQYKHLGVRYKCDHCEHQANTQGNLSNHKQVKHLEVRYSCNQCEYKSSTQGHLTIHNQAKHLGVYTAVMNANIKLPSKVIWQNINYLNTLGYNIPVTSVIIKRIEEIV